MWAVLLVFYLEAQSAEAMDEVSVVGLAARLGQARGGSLAAGMELARARPSEPGGAKLSELSALG